MYDPEGYEANKTTAANDAKLHVPQMVEEMRWGTNEVILDYGCGPGSTGAQFILPMVESTDSKMYSVDISPVMIKHAKEKFPDPRVTYAVGNILSDDFPFKDIRFDKIFSVYVLHYVKDFRGALSHFHKLLKPGGQLGFTLLTEAPLFHMYKMLGQSPKWSEYTQDYEEFIPEWVEKQEDAKESFKKALEDIGFGIQHLEVLKKEFVFPDLKTILDFAVSLSPFLKRIPKDLLSDYTDEHRDFLFKNWDKEKISEEEGVRMEYEMMYAVVTK